MEERIPRPECRHLRGRLSAAAILIGMMLMTSPLFGQGTARQTYSPAAVNAGANLFRTHCVSCHGPRGDQLPSVNLLQGKFPTATLADADIADVIMNGTANGLMPATSLSQSESSQVVAFLRSEASPTRTENIGGPAAAPRAASPKVPGDSAHGRLLFEKHGCLDCHRVGNEGSYSGPAFSDTSFVRTPEELRQSILEPDAEILPPNRSYRVVTLDGTTVIGRLLNHDTFRVQLIDAKGGLLSFAKANLREQGFLKKSPMPSYRGKLTPEELVDLVAYVATANQK